MAAIKLCIWKLKSYGMWTRHTEEISKKLLQISNVYYVTRTYVKIKLHMFLISWLCVELIISQVNGLSTSFINSGVPIWSLWTNFSGILSVSQMWCDMKDNAKVKRIGKIFLVHLHFARFRRRKKLCATILPILIM